MQVQIVLSPDVILEMYREIIREDIEADWKGQANLPEFSDVKRWVDRIQGSIDDAIRRVSEKGKSEVDKWIEIINEEVALMRQELPEKCDEVMQQVQANLVNLRNLTWTKMLSMLPTSLPVQGMHTSVRQIELEYEVTTNMKFQTNLFSILELASGASLKVSITFEVRSGDAAGQSALPVSSRT